MRRIKQLLPLLGLVTLTLSLAACPSKKHVHSTESATTTVYMGDPLKIVEGATLNSKIDMDFFNDTQELMMIHLVEFVDKDSYSTSDRTTKADLEKQAAAPKEVSEPSTSYNFKVKTLQDPDGNTLISLENESINIVLSNELINGKRFAASQKYKTQEKYMSEVLHFSVSEDHRNISLLLWTNDPKEGISVSAAYFTKDKKKQKVEYVGNYNYLRGIGVKTAWPKNKPIELNICGNNAKLLSEDLFNAKNLWNEALKPHQEIVMKVSDNYPPFSDLNQHCIYYIDSFKHEPKPNVAKYGSTMTPHFDTDTIYDSDILIFKSELSKQNQDIKRYMKKVVLHEMGHALGLDHQFDGTQSIMSYDFESPAELTDYDKAAIQDLYK